MTLKREVLSEAEKKIDANRKSTLGREALCQSAGTLQYPGATVSTTETATGKLHVWILIIAIITMSAVSWDVICTDLSDRKLHHIIISNLLGGLWFSDPRFDH